LLSDLTDELVLNLGCREARDPRNLVQRGIYLIRVDNYSDKVSIK
jgi:hypothetical protein